jgi:hypothetical protein
MTKEEFKKAFSIILGCAILSTSIWLLEIVKRIGWAGELWLEKDLLSPIVISIFIALAYITPFWMSYSRIDGRIILSTLTFSMINLSTYFLTTAILRGMLLHASASLWVFSLFVFALFVGGYYYVTDQLIMPLRKNRIVLFCLVLIGLLILSITTAFVIRGFGVGYSFTDAFKMGYTHFWLCILLGLVGVYLVEKYKEE